MRPCDTPGCTKTYGHKPPCRVGTPPSGRTGAIVRVARAVWVQHGNGPSSWGAIPTFYDEARTYVAAAIDVEEIASILGDHEPQQLLPDGVAPDNYDGRDHWMCSCDHDYGVHDSSADVDPIIREHEASVLRIALIGGSA